MVRRTIALVAAALVIAAASCSNDDGAATPATGDREPSSSPANAVVSTTPTTFSPETLSPSTTPDPTTPTSSPSTTSPPSTNTSSPPTTSTTTTSTTTTVAGVAGLATDALQTLEIGRSVEGRPIVAVERGTPGGVVVLVIGVIHGDEVDGVAILDRLATAPVPAGVDLWLIESMNPDGQAASQRQNAALVDLNRNFPFQWGPIGEPGDSQYAGTGPASEPETQAVVDSVSQIRPALGLWYHQDLFRLSPGEGFDGKLKARYSEITGVPILPITGGTYTGVAATWQRNTADAPSFIVELGPTLTPAEADLHTAAVLELATIVAAE